MVTIINGGVGGIGAGTGNSAAAAGKTGNTGKITAFGVNAEGGQTDGNIKTIKIELTNKNGNDSSDVVNRISGNGGAAELFMQPVSAVQAEQYS